MERQMNALPGQPAQRLYFVALCAISLGMATLSVLAETLPSLPRLLSGILWRFSLGGENNLASWWSGLLLLLGGLHAIDGYYRHRADDLNVARAWLVIGAVLCALSLDEIGSLHERVGLLRFGSWWSVLPFAMILLSGVTWSFWQLWHVPSHRRAAIVIAVGFACFAAVAAQEKLEWALQWPAWTLPIRMAVEECTELVGMLVLIRVTMRNSTGLFAGSRLDEKPALTAGHTLPAAALLAAMMCVPVFALVSARLPDQWRGHPSDWLAATLLFLAALAAWRSVLQGGKRPQGRVAGLGIVFLAASSASVQIDPAATLSLGSHVWGSRLVVLGGLLAIAAVMVLVLSDRPSQRRPAYGLLAVAGVTAAFAYSDANLLTTYVLTGVIALFAHCFAAPHVTELAVRVLIGAPALAIEQRALRASGQLHLQLLELTQDAVIIWEMDGKGIQYWNRAAERLYGFSRDEAYGKVTHSLLSTRPVGSAVGDLEARLARYGVWVGELVHTDRSGHVIEVESRLSLLAQRDGRWLILEVNRALTDREQASRAQAAAEQQVLTLRRYAGSIAG
jgi:PAS domain S-box-containing protein